MSYKYRPDKYDDWGIIKRRNAVGEMDVIIEVKKCPHRDLGECRSLKIDPFEDIGREIANKLNTYDDMLETLEAIAKADQRGQWNDDNVRWANMARMSIKKAMGE